MELEKSVGPSQNSCCFETAIGSYQPTELTHKSAGDSQPTEMIKKSVGCSQPTEPINKSVGNSQPTEVIHKSVGSSQPTEMIHKSVGCSPSIRNSLPHESEDGDHDQEIRTLNIYSLCKNEVEDLHDDPPPELKPAQRCLSHRYEGADEFQKVPGIPGFNDLLNFESLGTATIDRIDLDEGYGLVPEFDSYENTASRSSSNNHVSSMLSTSVNEQTLQRSHSAIRVVQEPQLRIGMSRRCRVPHLHPRRRQNQK